MKVVSLFAGIGGFDLGFERAGHEIVAHIEIDPKCRELLAARWPDAVALDDVRTAGKHNLPACDIITFGFPCQDLSVAGKRAGLKGERSGLFYEATRIIRELRPAWALFENVPGLLSSGNGADFAAVLSEMAECGYSGAWRVLDAQWLGVAQRRRRVFGLFTRLDSGAKRCAEILSIEKSLCGYPAPRRETGQGSPARAQGRVGSGGEPEVAKSIRTPTGGIDREDMHTLIPTVTHCLRSEADASEDGTGRGTPLIFAVAQPIRGNIYNNSDPMMEARGLIPAVAKARGACSTATGYLDPSCETSLPIVAGCLGATPAKHRSPNEDSTLIPEVAGRLQERDAKGADSGTKPGHLVPVGFYPTGGSHGLGNDKDVSPPVKVGSGIGISSPPAVAVPVAFSAGNSKDSRSMNMQVRRPTPTECERLQGFPDGWTAGFSDSTRYKMLGNAVCVNVAEWIAKRIKAVFNIC